MQFGEHPCATMLWFAHLQAEFGAVDLFVAEALALQIDDDAFRPVHRRIDEAPRRHLVESRRNTADRFAEADAAALAAGRAEECRRGEFGCEVGRASGRERGCQSW